MSSAIPIAERCAVVVGCEGYAALPAVARAVADADKVAAALERANYAVTAMTDAGQPEPELLRPTRDNLRRQLSAALPSRALGPDDTLLFYFAGHGLRLGDGFDYLAPLDAPETPAAADLVSVAWLIDRLAQTGAGSVVLATDVCRQVGRGQGVDITLLGRSIGFVLGCVCAGNREVGIAVGDWAHPTLETNSCLGIAMAAVAFPDPTANPERDDVYSKLAEWGRPWTRRALRLPTAVPEPPKEDGPSRRES